MVSIGEHSYLALPKGPLNENHLLILPIAHHRCALEIPEEVEAEINKFKKALIKLFKSEGLVTVFFERNYKSHHMQLQVVALPNRFSEGKFRLTSIFHFGDFHRPFGPNFSVISCF